VQANYNAVKEIVDALGGVDVDVYSNDPRGIYDSAVGLTIGPGIQHVDGKTALKLTRARNSKGGYGLPRSNFDREINQQRVLAAIQGKALTAGVLTNPQKVLEIIQALGNNVKTNLPTSQVRSAMRLAQAIGSSNIVSLPLTGNEVNLVTTGQINGASVVIPSAGEGNYTEIQAYIAEKL
jgi:anionic cell wall polymer biosynthesis LytR-Cps2A-Psr (LCP) family protein